MPVNLRLRWTTPMLHANSCASCSNTCRNTFAMRCTVIIDSLLVNLDRDARLFPIFSQGAPPCHPPFPPAFSSSFLFLTLTPIGQAQDLPLLWTWDAVHSSMVGAGLAPALGG